MDELILKQIFPDSPLRENLPAIELLNLIRSGNIDAFNEFLKIRDDYYYDVDWKHYDTARYYDDLTTILHRDVRDKLILLVVNKDYIDLDVLEVLTRNYDIGRIKDKLYSRLKEYSLKLRLSKVDEKWNDLVRNLFSNPEELIICKNDWKKFINFDDVIKITTPYPIGDIYSSAHSYLTSYIEYNFPSQKIISDKFIGAFEYKNDKVWLYECKLVEFKSDVVNITINYYTILPEKFFCFRIYKDLKENEIEFKELIVESIKFGF